tara:strand:+ start:621 stop:1295 length:675 start_codon:yes stop_codon:yes gene_type:complete
MKNVNDILFICQARLESQRVPKKMIRPFCGTTLVDILIEKIKQSSIIPYENFYLSVHDKELMDIGYKHGTNIFKRSKDSALAENSIPLIYEWHDKLPYKYIILLNACNPLLTIETIDQFVESYINSDKGGMFGVIGKKQYFWDENGKMISPWPTHQKIMNTKTMGITYEAAHCLYASEMGIIKKGYWMDEKLPPEPELFIIDDELEIFDIDYEWQFKVGEKLYK